VRLASVILVLVGSGVALAAGPSPTAPARSDRAYTCGYGEFPKDALRSPLGAERARDALGRALRRFIRYDRRLGGEFTAGRTWRVLRRESAFALFGGAGSRGFTNSYVVFRPTRRGWRLSSYGDCVPEVVVPGAEVAEWYLPRGTRLRRATRRVSVLVETGTCYPSRAGIERSRRREHRAEITITPRSVRVVVLLEPEPEPPGGFCAGVGLILRRTIVLPEPLQGRRLLDARTVPAWPVERGRRGG
jgi:hypothetical protein